MKRSTERILTTHVGSLARPDALIPFLRSKERGQPYDRETYATLVRDWPGQAEPAPERSSQRGHGGAGGPSQPHSASGVRGPPTVSEPGQLGAGCRNPLLARTEIDQHGGVILYVDDPAEAVLVVSHLVLHDEHNGGRSGGRGVEGTCGQEAPGGAGRFHHHQYAPANRSPPIPRPARSHHRGSLYPLIRGISAPNDPPGRPGPLPRGWHDC